MSTSPTTATSDFVEGKQLDVDCYHKHRCKDYGQLCVGCKHNKAQSYYEPRVPVVDPLCCPYLCCLEQPKELSGWGYPDGGLCVPRGYAWDESRS